MNEELIEKANEALITIIDDIANIRESAIDQAPLIIQELYEAIESAIAEVDEDFIRLTQTAPGEFVFDAQFYNGGCSLIEMLENGFKAK